MSIEKAAQRAAERVAVLEALTDEQKEKYRAQRNTSYFRMAVNTLDYIYDLDEQDQITLLHAIHIYNKTGKAIEIKSKSLKSTFDHVIKPQLDNDFDNYCITCYMTEENGKKGAKTKWIQERMYQKLKDKDFSGIEVKRLIKDDPAAWQELRAKVPGKTMESFKKYFERVKEAAETEYTEAQEKARLKTRVAKK